MFRGCQYRRCQAEDHVVKAGTGDRFTLPGLLAMVGCGGRALFWSCALLCKTPVFPKWASQGPGALGTETRTAQWAGVFPQDEEYWGWEGHTQEGPLRGRGASRISASSRDSDGQGRGSVGLGFCPPGELRSNQINSVELLWAAGQTRNVLDLVTFFFGSPFTVEGLDPYSISE